MTLRTILLATVAGATLGAGLGALAEEVTLSVLIPTGTGHRRGDRGADRGLHGRRTRT